MLSIMRVLLSDGFSLGCAAAGACAGHGGRNRRRADLTGQDMILLQVSLTVLANVPPCYSATVGLTVRPELYRRILCIYPDVIRPDPAYTTTPPVPTQTTKQTHLLLAAPPLGEQP